MSDKGSLQGEENIVKMFHSLEYGVPFFAFLNEKEIWGPFVVVDPHVGEMLGAQLGAAEENKLTWFEPSEVGRIIVFSGTPVYNADDGSFSLNTSKGTVMIRPLWESDYVNFGLPGPVPLQELYELANQNFAPLELENEE